MTAVAAPIQVLVGDRGQNAEDGEPARPGVGLLAVGVLGGAANRGPYDGGVTGLPGKSGGDTTVKAKRVLLISPAVAATAAAVSAIHDLETKGTHDE